MTGAFDLAVVGSGFAGTLLAAAARKLGRTVVLLEKGTHPRFAIGESSSPLANVLLEQFAEEFDLPELRPLAKWGTWRRERPEIACGLKRGFTFFRHETGVPFETAADRGGQLFVAASPRDEVADTHWYRADVDELLLRHARAAGAAYIDRVELRAFAETGRGVEIEGTRLGEPVAIRAKFAVDASGPRGFLAGALDLDGGGFPGFPATQGLFTHFDGVARLDETPPLDFEGAPYPADDAALHHVFDGGWIWVLRFSNGIVSAGCAVTDALAKEIDLRSGGEAWSRLLSRFPAVRAQFSGARPLLPWVHSPRLSFRVRRASGTKWALLPSAAAFVDPLLSTGIPLTLLGIERFARAIREDWGSSRFAVRDRGRVAAKPGRSGCRRRPRRGALRELRRLPRLLGADDALLRRGELLRERPTARTARARAVLPAPERAPVRAGASEYLRGGSPARRLAGLPSAASS